MREAGRSPSTRGAPVSATVLAALGAVTLVGAGVLAVLGSFAYVAAASVGMWFVAAALIAWIVRPTMARASAILALAGIALVVFGLVATPFFYAGWGLIAVAVVLALVRSTVSPG